MKLYFVGSKVDEPGTPLKLVLEPETREDEEFIRAAYAVGGAQSTVHGDSAMKLSSIRVFRTTTMIEASVSYSPGGGGPLARGGES